MPLVTKPKELIVEIDQAGVFRVAGQVLTEQQLTDRLRQAKRDNPGRESVLIRGDERADWKYVARVFSICYQLDIKDRRFAVIPPEEQTDEQ
jgi:biopolymer transport protein ExbD